MWLILTMLTGDKQGCKMMSHSYLVLVGGAEFGDEFRGVLIGGLQQHPALLQADVLGFALPLALWLFGVAVASQARRKGAIRVLRRRRGTGGLAMLLEPLSLVREMWGGKFTYGGICT